MRAIVLLLLAATAQCRAAGSDAVPPALRVCGDAAGYAPYTYSVRGGNGEAQGYSVDYLKAMLARSGRTANVTLLPWKRCLLLAKQGQYDLVLDAADLPDRRRDFILPRPYYKATPIFVFRAGAEPKTPASKDELAAMRRCQVAGWDYSLSGTKAGPDRIITGSNVAATFNMLRHGRCDIMHFQLELLRGLENLQGSAAYADVQYRSVPWASVITQHFGVSRAISYAVPLAEMLDGGIARFDKAEADRLLKRHLPR